jgi:ribose transport system substrate-binding protein
MFMRGQFKTSLACVAAVSLLLAACGSDDAASETSDAPVESTAESTDDPVDTTAESGGGDGVAAAQARVDEFSQTLTEIGITDTVAVPADLEVFYAQCPVPVCEQIAQGLQKAVDAVGGTLTIQAYDGSPEGTQAAFQAGVQAAPDIFMSSGNPVEWYEQELVEFEALGIPVVQWSIPGGLVPDGMTANLITGGDYYFQGALIADWIVAETGGEANVLAMNMGGTFPVLGLEQQGFENQMAEVCPDCKLNVQEISLDQLLAGEHISVAISEFQKDPEINYIFTGFGDMLIGLHEALADNGLAEGVPSASQAGTTANYQLIADGKQAIDIGLPSEFLAYRALDAGLRALAGQDIGQVDARPLTDVAGASDTPGAEDILIAGLPMQILTADTVGDPTTPWAGIEGFQDQFLALWETGS